MSALVEAVRILGSQSALARACGVKQGHVWAWLNREGYAVPLESCPDIERATAGAVRCEDLRPDVDWLRDSTGQVTGYQVRIAPPEPQPAAQPAKVA